MKKIVNFLLISITFFNLIYASPRYIRVNQVGYLTNDKKVANLFSNDDLSGLTFSVVRISDNAVVFGPASIGSRIGSSYCNYTYHYREDRAHGGTKNYTYKKYFVYNFYITHQ